MQAALEEWFSNKALRGVVLKQTLEEWFSNKAPQIL